MKRVVAIAALWLAASGSASALDEAIGRALFRRAWVPAPSSTTGNDGLGPLFNARSCAACHRGLDRAPVSLDDTGTVISQGLVVRLSDRAGRGDPVYGHQLQTSGLPGIEPEGRVQAQTTGYRATDLAYGPLAPDTRQGARAAPALHGLGELDAVSDTAIVALAREAQARGAKGRVHWVSDESGNPRVGRFGWKASRATLKGQVETAFLLDLGLSTDHHREAGGDCTVAEDACLAAPHGGSAGSAEISDEITGRITAYLASIAPAAAAQDARGAELFAMTGCASCHLPTLPGPHGPVRAFTDLLLHDLGPGLDGGATEPGVSPTEWRTAPLWGLSRILHSRAGLLHDGRAATVEEAVEFHGGEGGPSALRFRSLAKKDRERLVAFLKAL